MKKNVYRHVLPAFVLLMSAPLAHAYKIHTSDHSLKVRWDNTFKYSNLYRLSDPDDAQLSQFAATPAGDGDFNFNSGIASARLDWLTEFDVRTDHWGVRFSADAWYDDVYNDLNDNTSGFTHNVSAPANQFTHGAQKAMGKDARVQDAFVYLKGELGDAVPARVNVGRHTVIFGESLLGGNNGAAAAQGPVDIIKAATVPGAKVKEFLLPVLQISGNIQPTRKLTVDAYYQFEWEESPFFAPGSFLSPADFVSEYSESLISTPFGGTVFRTDDVQADDNGQWGIQLRYRPSWFSGVLGVFAANFHDKLMSATYFDPIANAGAGTYSRVFHENIKVYGMSMSTVLSDNSFSFETSLRDNQPLVGGSSGFVVLPGMTGVYDNDNNPAYPVGKTAHATVVAIRLLNPMGFLKDGGSVVLQYDFHTALEVDKNEKSIDATTSASAHQITAILQADYFNVSDGMDISVPLVVSFSEGRSRVYAGWVEDGGTVDLGLKGTYLGVWDFSFNYRDYYGVHKGVGVGQGHFDQTLWDRDFISFSIQRAI